MGSVIIVWLIELEQVDTYNDVSAGGAVRDGELTYINKQGIVLLLTEAPCLSFPKLLIDGCLPF